MHAMQPGSGIGRLQASANTVPSCPAYSRTSSPVTRSNARTGPSSSPANTRSSPEVHSVNAMPRCHRQTQGEAHECPMGWDQSSNVRLGVIDHSNAGLPHRVHVERLGWMQCQAKRAAGDFASLPGTCRDVRRSAVQCLVPPVRMSQKHMYPPPFSVTSVTSLRANITADTPDWSCISIGGYALLSACKSDV